MTGGAERRPAIKVVQRDEDGFALVVCSPDMPGLPIPTSDTPEAWAAAKFRTEIEIAHGAMLRARDAMERARVVVCGDAGVIVIEEVDLILANLERWADRINALNGEGRGE